ncbi:MAG: Gldg family protein [Promethearchaeota archaeon]
MAPADPGRPKICFDYLHNNQLVLESNSFVSFVEFLFQSGYMIGKIQANLALEKLEQYDVFIIGNMSDSYLEIEEIQVLLEYVKGGGSLLVLSDEGGDFSNRNNISELTEHFGVTFNADIVFDLENFEKKEIYPVISKFERHFITQNLHKIVHSSGCSLSILKSRENEDVDVTPLAFTSEVAKRKVWNGHEWVEQAAPNYPVLAASHYFSGKVVCLGNVSTFSSLGKKSYGLDALDNKVLIADIFSWLVNKAGGEGKVVKPIYYATALEQDLYFWGQKMVKAGKWPSLSAIVNQALKELKNETRDRE